MISSIPPPVDPFNFASHHPSWSTPTYGAQSSLFTDGPNKMNQSRSPTYGNPVESPRTGSSDGSIGGLMYSEGNASGSASPSISLPLTSHQEASGAIFSKTTPSMAAINSGRRASSPAALYLPNVSTIKNGQSSQHSLPGYPGEENDASSSNLSCPPGYLYSFRPAADSGTPHLGAWPSMTHPHLRTVQSDPNAGLLNGATSAYPAQRFEMGLMGLPEYPEYFENTGSDAMSMMHNMAYDPYQVKHRKRTSPEQLAVLETAFEENSKPSAVVRKAMADQLGMTPRSVQVWFQNRRQKRKMLERKRQEGDTLEQAEASDNLPAQAYPALFHIRTNTGTFPLDTTKTHSQPGLDGWSSRYPVNHPTPSSDHPGGSHPTPNAVISTEEERRSVESSLRPTKTTATPSQARRGSLPYPTPINTSMNSLSNHSFVARGSNSGSEKATRSQIPLHLAVSMGGRRASLPNNSRSISLGSFKPPRTGNNPAASGLSQVFQRELSPIADRDQPDAHPSYSGEGGPLSYFEHLPNWSGGSSALSGPLPNPDYSFGFTDHTPFNSATLNDASLPLVTPGLEYPSAQSAMGYRDRMGSLASVMSQGSQATSSDTTEWAGTPYLYGNMPFGFDAAKIIQPEDGNHLSLPYGFDADTRRASAPADLLQNLNFLEVQSKRSSPLNPNSAESGNLSNHLDGSMAKLMTEAVDPSFILPVNTYSRGAADLGRCDAYQNYQGCTNRSFSSTPTISPVPAAREGKSKESGAANDATAAWGGPWQ